jgi:toxin ParE1/3/4
LAELRLAVRADTDIDELLDWSERRFGAAARVRYGALIDTAFRDIASNPERPGSHPRPELGADLRSYHLRHSRTRARRRGGQVGQPRHVIYDRIVSSDLVRIERVLHDAMDVERHIPE